MPYHIEEDHADCPSSESYAVVKDSDGEVMGCHGSRSEAEDQMAALYAAEENAAPRRKTMSIVETALTRMIDGATKLRNLLYREWSGAASDYDTTEAYCAACLIDVNAAADRDEKAQSHCMLPAKSPGSDSYNFEGIQAAAGGHGITQVQKPDDVPEDAWESALKSAANTIISQYNANDETAPDSVYEIAGKEPPKEDSMAERATGMTELWQQVDWALWDMEGYPWLHDIFLDDDGSLFAIASSGGKLYRYSLSVGDNAELSIGEPEQVVYDFKALSRTFVLRQSDGNVRWFSISSTAVLNRVGEIDSRELFDSMVRHAEETGEYPYRTFYHQGKVMRYGQCDFLARDEYCFITSGIYELDGENAILAELEIDRLEDEPENWGESICFMPTAVPESLEVAEGVNIPVYNSGYCIEISLLPEDDAASLFTMPMRTEVSRMRKEVKDALTALAQGDEDIVDQFAAKVDSVNRTVKEDGLIAREAVCPTCGAKAREDETPAETPAEETPAETPAPKTPEASAETTPEEEPVEEEKKEEEKEKSAEAQTEEAGETPTVEETDEAQVEMALDETAIDAIAAKVGRVVKPIAEQLDALVEESRAGRDDLNARLEALEKDEDEKREEWRADLPRKQKVAVTYRPREAKKDKTGTGAGEDESLADRAAGTLSSIRGG